MKVLEFRLTIVSDGPDRAHVAAEDSLGGRVSESVGGLAQVLRVSRLFGPERTAIDAEGFNRQLEALILPVPIRNHLFNSIHHAIDVDGASRLRVRLCLSQGLQGVPWEITRFQFLHEGEWDTLGLADDFTIVRDVDHPDPRRSLRPFPLNDHLFIAGAGISNERLRHIAQPLNAPLNSLTTWSGVKASLGERPAMVTFAGHGSLAADGSTILHLGAEGSEQISTDDFASAISEKTEIVLLAACNTAPLAQKLVEEGVFAAVGFPADVETSDADMFCTRLLECLAEGIDLDLAVAASRYHVHDHGSKLSDLAMAPLFTRGTSLVFPIAGGSPQSVEGLDEIEQAVVADIGDVAPSGHDAEVDVRFAHPPTYSHASTGAGPWFIAENSGMIAIAEVAADRFLFAGIPMSVDLAGPINALAPTEYGAFVSTTDAVYRIKDIRRRGTTGDMLQPLVGLPSGSTVLAAIRRRRSFEVLGVSAQGTFVAAVDRDGQVSRNTTITAEIATSAAAAGDSFRVVVAGVEHVMVGAEGGSALTQIAKDGHVIDVGSCVNYEGSYVLATLERDRLEHKVTIDVDGMRLVDAQVARTDSIDVAVADDQVFVALRNQEEIRVWSLDSERESV